MQGKVKFWNDTRGFGFITDKDGQEYFCHASQLPKELSREERKLTRGQEVVFDIGQGKDGRDMAVNVILI